MNYGENEEKEEDNNINNSSPLNLPDFTYAVPNIINGNIYEVGPNKTYAEPNEIPWSELSPGDLVKIFYREQPYLTQIALTSSGTSNNPIRIYGITDSDGNKPILSGNNATIPLSLTSFYTEWTRGLGVITIYGSWENKPSFIEIANLEITGAYPENSFNYEDDNSEFNYVDGAAAVWLLADNISIKGCNIYGNGNGIFSQANDTEPNRVSHNLLIEGCTIYDNGVNGQDRQHNLYLQSAGTIVQFNQIKMLRDGAGGSSLKDRSSGTIIRYNLIESGARTIDLVEPEDTFDYLNQFDDFKTTYVYGNIIINDTSSTNGGAGNMIHYGGDNGDEATYRNGTLKFYNNSIYIKSEQSDAWRVSLFDISLNTATVDMQNCIIYGEGTSNFHLMRDHGILNISKNNWISNNYTDGRDGFDGIINADPEIIIGNNPAYINPDLYDFTLNSNSECLNKAGVISNYNNPFQYSHSDKGKLRITNNDLGALE